MNILKSIPSSPLARTGLTGVHPRRQPQLAGRPPSITVNYADLDLSTSAGAHHALSAASAAPPRACAGTHGHSSLVEIADWHSCVNAAAIVMQCATVHSPLLTAVYTGQRPIRSRRCSISEPQPCTHPGPGPGGCARPVSRSAPCQFRGNIAANRLRREPVPARWRRAWSRAWPARGPRSDAVIRSMT